MSGILTSILDQFPGVRSSDGQANVENGTTIGAGQQSFRTGDGWFLYNPAVNPGQTQAPGRFWAKATARSQRHPCLAKC